ncbi:DUF6192 family protein [Actinocorallia longicatena]|uniref:Uncharacterized protein n=1 Tax=Actinocorallia longicatena TaxID=111803 RepID=A0ABP6QP93_9ACTN
MPPAAAERLEEIRQSREFLELVTACSAFTGAIGRAIPNLRGQQLTDAEKGTVLGQVAKVRATADWLESAVNTGNLSLDEGLAALLRGE